MDDSLDPIDNFLTFLFLGFCLGQKLDEVKDLAVKIEKDVFDFKSALAQPWIPIFVKFLGDPSLKLTAFIIIVFLLGVFRFFNEGILRHCVKA